MGLKVFLSKVNNDEVVTIDHDDFRHIIVFENHKPTYIDTIYKMYHSAVKLDATEIVADLEEREELMKKNWDFI